MEETHCIGERVLDQHAFGVTCNEEFGGRVCVVGEQDGWLIVTEVSNEELAVDALKWTRLLLVEARIAVLAMGTSSSTVRQADGGRSAISVSGEGERRRRVRKVMPAASSR